MQDQTASSWGCSGAKPELNTTIIETHYKLLLERLGSRHSPELDEIESVVLPLQTVPHGHASVCFYDGPRLSEVPVFL